MRSLDKIKQIFSLYLGQFCLVLFASDFAVIFVKFCSHYYLLLQRQVSSSDFSDYNSFDKQYITIWN